MRGHGEQDAGEGSANRTKSHDLRDKSSAQSVDM
jgi:hypothetical protein